MLLARRANDFLFALSVETSGVHFTGGSGWARAAGRLFATASCEGRRPTYSEVAGRAARAGGRWADGSVGARCVSRDAAPSADGAGAVHCPWGGDRALRGHCDDAGQLVGAAHAALCDFDSG